MKISEARAGGALALGGAGRIAVAGRRGRRRRVAERQRQAEAAAAAAGASSASNRAAIANSAARNAPRSGRSSRRSSAQDWAAASAALPAAQAGAQSPAARYIVGQLQLQIGRGTQNQPVQAQAVDAMIASGGAPAEQMPPLLGAQAELRDPGQRSGPPREARADARSRARAEQYRADQPARRGQDPAQQEAEALALYRRALQLSEAAGQRRPRTLYRQALALAYRGARMAASRRRAVAVAGSRAYPTPENWRTALVVYRELGQADSRR